MRHAMRQVVPMLNPDGVAVGNYRCSMAGLDLNRMWKEPSKRLTPAIWHMKQMMRTLQARLGPRDEIRARLD